MLTELSYRTIPGQASQQLINTTMLTELSYRTIPGQAPQPAVSQYHDNH